jgi:actin related protein 2/3 complex subunit 2
MEARRTAGLNNVPSCLWSSSPPLELKGAPGEALLANAGFVTFGNVEKWIELVFPSLSHHNKLQSSIDAVIFPRHVEGKKLDRTVWSLSTFHAYVSYHVKVRFLSSNLDEFLLLLS